MCRYAKRRAYDRAVKLISAIRVVKQQPPELIAQLLYRLFTVQVYSTSWKVICVHGRSHFQLA